MSEPAENRIDAPSTDRLVIRIKLVPKEDPVPPPTAPRSNKAAMALAAGVLAVCLGWFGIGSLRSDPPPPPPVVTAKTPSAAAQMAEPVEPALVQQPDAPPSAINEVIPDVPQSALNTIRGTVRVAIRVKIDRQGTVVAATAADRGPSRYFERLSVEASKKWTFTPAKSDDQRLMLVRFHFTRDGATAHATSATG